MGLSDPLHYKLNWCRPPKESAKLRALRAKNVFTCQPAFYAYVLTCQRAFRAHVPARHVCQRAFRAQVPTCHACLRTNVPCVPTCLECLCLSRVSIPCVLMYSHVNVA